MTQNKPPLQFHIPIHTWTGMRNSATGSPFDLGFDCAMPQEVHRILDVFGKGVQNHPGFNPGLSCVRKQYCTLAP